LPESLVAVGEGPNALVTPTVLAEVVVKSGATVEDGSREVAPVGEIAPLILGLTGFVTELVTGRGAGLFTGEIELPSPQALKKADMITKPTSKATKRLNKPLPFLGQA
jgi:hypothetical protein